MYQIDRIENVNPAIIADVALAGDYLVIRTNPISSRETLWSSHKTAKLAIAALRRHRSRDVVTR